MRRTAFLWAFTWAFSSPAFAGKAPEVVEAARLAAAAEVHDLERRALALEAQTHERRDRLKQRLRAIYKLSSGGYLRLLSASETAAELQSRTTTVSRLLERDLEELAAVREESRVVDTEHARRGGSLAGALTPDKPVSRLDGDSPFLRWRGKLPRPVLGPVVGRYGVQKDASGEISWTRHGVELRATPDCNVRAVAPGLVKFAGEQPGYGLVVVLEHEDGWLTVYGRLKDPKVAAGDPVAGRAILAESAAPTVYFALAQGTTTIDPSQWLVP